jgi:hypothetical protein
LIGHGRGIAGVACIYLHRYRPSLGVREHSVHDDWPPFLAVAVMAELRQRTSPPLVVATRDIIQDVATVLETALGKLILNALLALEKPIHGLIEIFHSDIDHVELLRQGGGVPVAGTAELRARIENSFGNHGEDQVAFARAFGGDDGVKSNATDGAEDGFDMSVGEGSLNGEDFLGREKLFASEEASEGFDVFRGQGGKIGEGTFSDFLSFAVGFPEQDGRWGPAIWHAIDIHVHIIPQFMACVKIVIPFITHNTWLHIAF